MPRGTVVSVSMAPIVAAAVLGGPAAAGWVALLGTTELRELRGRVPWYGSLFNHAGIGLPVVLGGLLLNALRDVSPDLMDILGAASALPVGTDGAADEGGAEYVFRLAGPTGIYGGTLEVFRNMIAQHALGLGKPNYSQAR